VAVFGLEDLIGLLEMDFLWGCVVCRLGVGGEGVGRCLSGSGLTVVMCAGSGVRIEESGWSSEVRAELKAECCASSGGNSVAGV
jgi:hypothetical protein